MGNGCVGGLVGRAGLKPAPTSGGLHCWAGKVVLELKAVSGLENVHLAQAVNYLEAFGLEVGLLINFGATKLEFRRVVNSLNRRLR